MSNKVMVDPSLLLNSETADEIFDLYYGLNEEFEFYLPSSFNQFVENGGLMNHYRDYNSEEDLIETQNIYRFYEIRNPEKITRPDKIRDFVGTFEGFGSIDVFGDKETPKTYHDLYTNLSYSQGDIRKEILYDEAVFLFESSFLISRIKKPFNALRNAGPTMIEFRRNTADELVETEPKNINENTRQSKLDEFFEEDVSMDARIEDTSFDEDTENFKTLYKKVKDLYEKYKIYIAFSGVSETLADLLDIESGIEGWRQRISEIIQEPEIQAPQLKEEVTKELEEIKRELVEIATPKPLKLLVLLFRLGELAFVVVDP